MWLIYMLSLLVTLAVNKGRGKRRRYLAGVVDEDLALTTLASLDVVAGIFDNVVNERTFCSSVDATWNRSGGTIGEGPIIVGLAHSDYSPAEIEEFIENTGSWNEGDLVNQEIAKRKIRIVGAFPGDAADEGLSDGEKIHTKTKWVLLQGQSLQQWAYNRSAGALTTGSAILTEGVAHLWPSG